MKRVLFIGVALIFYFGSLSVLFSMDTGSPIDLSEKILKNKWGMVSDFGSRGFGIHDSGDEKFKVLNWNFEIIREFPITTGDGPADIKGEVYYACWTDNDKFVLNGYNDRLIKIFKSDGTCDNSYRIDFLPREIVLHRDKLYVFNLALKLCENSTFFAKVFEPESGKCLETLRFKEVIDAGAPNLNNLRNDLEVSMDEKGNFYFLHGIAGYVYKVDGSGNLLSKIKLPYKAENKITYLDGGKHKVFSRIKIYKGLFILNNNIYTTFIEPMEKKSKQKISRLLKINLDGDLSEVAVSGRFQLLGHFKNTIYVFDRREYIVRALKISKK